MPLLRLESVSKSFGGTAALRGISLEVRAGEALGLIGENGAGKSTLIKILSGVHRPDSGQVFWDGRAIELAHPRAALAAGIATIHQELACFERLTVAENLLMGEPWPRHFWGGTNWRRLNAEAARRLRAAELAINPAAMFHSLNPAQRQAVAIARALAQNARLLILDEPTASLTEPESERLLARLQRLKEEGVALLYVSHRLDEVLRLADRVAVLRDGAQTGEYPARAATVERMVRDMVGQELEASIASAPAPVGPPVLAVEGYSRAGLFSGISFTLRSGEILGLAGLVGAGRSELARALFGLYPPDSGTAQLDGKSYAPESPGAARRSGVAYVPEERKRQGFVLDHSLSAGLSIGWLDALSRFGWLRPDAEAARVSAAITKFGIKARSPDQPVGTLSGGNQQKALLARWLECGPRVIILDEPTRGVDVGAKAEIHNLIRQLAAQGTAVLLISSDLPEVQSLSSRLLVMRKGQLTAELSGAEATREKILKRMLAV